ncbi:plasmid IncI1-type surface exclusion protein ExcA [Serratia marcescens]|uniref:plasmid IncI1-type surface exclusion protein ExcA n=1 Tax=Serratia marcescens TaxID=615 RepID=UPI0007601F47|nr:plasmid IncI1-type surface exclusion protein ExcA [Serratia marcescens]
MMAQRMKTAKEGWFFLFKLAYGLLALPFLLFVALIYTFMSFDSGLGSQQGNAIIFTSIVWAAVIIPVGVFFFSVINKRRLLKIITNDIKHPDYFMPEQGYEMFHEGDGKYLGIDIKRGTILYVHRIRKGEVDVVGLDMKDWTNREVEGKMFRLYTKLPELPRIEISTPWAQRWFDTLGSMEFKQYQPAMPFSEYVDIHREQLERENHIAIPRLA